MQPYRKKANDADLGELQNQLNANGLQVEDVSATLIEEFLVVKDTIGRNRALAEPQCHGQATVCSDAGIPLIPLVFPVTAFALAYIFKAADELDAHDVFCHLIAELPFYPDA